MVMPGTLMYECCAHTLRIFIQRLGWVSANPQACYEPVLGVHSVLKCRGPVTPETKHVIYEVEIKSLGYNPEPFVIADANMYADGHRIVQFRDMSMRLSGTTRDEVAAFWKARSVEKTAPQTATHSFEPFDREQLEEFTTGSPSKAFGDRYTPFDQNRFIARLPAPPYLFMDRVIHCEPAQWDLKPDGWVHAQYDVAADDWYFQADRSAVVPYAVLLEMALQPCGWLAAYMGSALHSKGDLKFRNLGGTARLTGDILADDTTVNVQVRLTNVSEAADMIIENFEFKVSAGGKPVYSGDSYFGFFTPQALNQQVGIRDAIRRIYRPPEKQLTNAPTVVLEDIAPFFPEAPSPPHGSGLTHQARMPAKALRMIDAVDVYLPHGGPSGLGYIRGSKKVDPSEWFFKAHFYQDPVCPGSLGLESFLQLLKFIALDRFELPEAACRFAALTDAQHTWIYRGQIVPDNETVTVEACVTALEPPPVSSIRADGFLLVDGLPIYEMKDFGLKIVTMD